MEPVINPWMIYLLGIVEPLNFILLILMTALSFGSIGFLLAWISDEYKNEDEKMPSWIKKFIIMSIISIVIFLALPRKDTVISMYVANFITVDKLESASTSLKSEYKDIKKIINDYLMKQEKEK